MLFVVFSICAGAQYEENITAEFQNTTYTNGKATLKLSLNFPRTEQGKMAIVIFKIAFSQNDRDLAWSQIHIDGSGFPDNGLTTPNREVYLFGDKNHTVGTEHSYNKYCYLKGKANSAVQIYAKVLPTNTENPIFSDIPLAISDDIKGDVTVSTSTATCEVYNAEGGELTYTENGSFLITQATLSSTSTSGEGGDSPIGLEVGEGKDITNNTNNAATVTGTVSNGTATLNVDSNKACVVAYTKDNGATYNRLTAIANSEGGYDFVVPETYTDTMKFAVAVKGDSDGDGDIDALDLSLFVDASNGDYSSSIYNSALTSLIGDTDTDNDLDAIDLSMLVDASNGIVLNW
jgi:hypothetical protein